jgi:hypothetical protein
MKRVQIPSSKKGGEPYTVTLEGENGDACECKAFQYSQADPATCKHIIEAKRQRDEAANEDADREMGIDPDGGQSSEG